MFVERQLANQILNTYWVGRNLPVDPSELARLMGVQVEEYAFCSDEDESMRSVSGMYLADHEGHPLIRVAADQYPLRQRFTVAHELGHHVMKHGDRMRDTAGAFSSMNFDPVEVSANRFAAELLMPYVAVEYFVKQEGVTDLEELARRFQVSEVAMRYRLKNLGLL